MSLRGGGGRSCLWGDTVRYWGSPDCREEGGVTVRSEMEVILDNISPMNEWTRSGVIFAWWWSWLPLPELPWLSWRPWEMPA